MNAEWDIQMYGQVENTQKRDVVDLFSKNLGYFLCRSRSSQLQRQKQQNRQEIVD